MEIEKLAFSRRVPQLGNSGESSVIGCLYLDTLNDVKT